MDSHTDRISMERRYGRLNGVVKKQHA